MDLVDINVVNDYLKTGVHNIGDLVKDYQAMLMALDAYVVLRTGLGGSSDSFLKEVEQIICKVKTAIDELKLINKQFQLCKYQKKSVEIRLKPYVKNLQAIHTDIISLVKRGW